MPCLHAVYSDNSSSSNNNNNNNNNLIFSKYFRNTIRVSNILDPDQAKHFVVPDLGPNILQRLTADDKLATGEERV